MMGVLLSKFKQCTEWELDFDCDPQLDFVSDPRLDLLAILIKGRRSLSENPETQPVVRKARN